MMAHYEDRPSFMTLPGELRNVVYESVAHSTEEVIVRDGGAVPHSLHQVCRQTRDEFDPVFAAVTLPTATIIAKVVDFDFSHLIDFCNTYSGEREVGVVRDTLEHGQRQIKVKLHFTKPVTETWRGLRVWLEFYMLSLNGHVLRNILAEVKGNLFPRFTVTYEVNLEWGAVFTQAWHGTRDPLVRTHLDQHGDVLDALAQVRYRIRKQVRQQLMIREWHARYGKNPGEAEVMSQL